MKNKAVFLDRDGTIIHDCNYLDDPKNIQWLPNVMDILRFLKEQGFLLLVITNQSGVARGYFAEKNIHIIHDTMQMQLLKNVDIKIDDFYYCPHHPEGIIDKYRYKCDCRKPASGLFEKAIKDWNIDIENSIAIGDKIRDLVPAKAVGISKLFLYSSVEENKFNKEVNYNYIYNWKKLVDYI